MVVGAAAASERHYVIPPSRPITGMRYVFALVVCCASLARGCDATSDDSDNARIVFGVSVDGVSMGDNGEVAVSRLGTPDCTNVNGMGYSVAVYETGRHAGLSVILQPTSAREASTVTGFAIQAPYSGSNSDGVGLGTQRSRFEQAIGDPVFANEIRSDDPAITIYSYTFREYALSATFRSERLESFLMQSGAHESLGGIPTQCSRPTA